MNMVIIMAMNIYINVQNIERLSKEPNKSGLINELLDAHYGHLSSYPKIRLSDSGIVENESDVRFDLPPVITQPKEALNAVKGQLDKTCKHGFPPAFCKHSKPGKPCK